MPPKRRGANRHILNRLCLAAYFRLVFLTAILQSPESSGEADIEQKDWLKTLSFTPTCFHKHLLASSEEGFEGN